MKVVIISGPTATGKTDIAIDLAEKFGGEIVNFDSLLFYNEINIGTAKPTLFQREKVKHYMIDVRSISKPMNAADFAKEAFPIIEELLRSKKIVYLVGGSGFYLQALLKGMFDSPTTPPDVLLKSDQLYAQEGIEPFLKILKEHDLKSFERYHINDHYRIRRAVEHWWTTNQPLSAAREVKDQINALNENKNIHAWEIEHLHLDIPKEEHLAIIQNRTKRMIQAGLIEETAELLKRGFQGSEKPLQSIGYFEAVEYLRGHFHSLDECEERIIISTRQLAKSQRTWFKRDHTKKTYHPLKERNEIFLRVDKFINS